MLRAVHPSFHLSLCNDPRGSHYSDLHLADEETVLKRTHNHCGGARNQFQPFILERLAYPLLSVRMFSALSKERLPKSGINNKNADFLVQPKV